MGYDIAGLRAAEFPWAGQTTYLDHASIGPLPERTRQAGERFLHRRLRYLGALWEDDDIRRAVRVPGHLVRGLPPGPNHDVLTTALDRLEVPLPARVAG